MSIVLANMDVALRERACATDVRLSIAVADHGYWQQEASDDARGEFSTGATDFELRQRPPEWKPPAWRPL